MFLGSELTDEIGPGQEMSCVHIGHRKIALVNVSVEDGARRSLTIQYSQMVWPQLSTRGTVSVLS